MRSLYNNNHISFFDNYTVVLHRVEYQMRSLCSFGVDGFVQHFVILFICFTVNDEFVSVIYG